MPLPRWLARVNLRFTNRLLGPLTGIVPGMGMILHVGRKTGRLYRTPVLVFRRDGRCIIALTYGRDCQWVQNVLAANGCELANRSEKTSLSQPRIVHDPQRKLVPPVVRLALALLNVSDFLELTISNTVASQ
jgi:deazaflavin-dependent oxidoreductase (nitroreductase family)